MLIPISVNYSCIYIKRINTVRADVAVDAAVGAKACAAADKDYTAAVEDEACDRDDVCEADKIRGRTERK